MEQGKVMNIVIEKATTDCIVQEQVTVIVEKQLLSIQQSSPNPIGAYTSLKAGKRSSLSLNARIWPLWHSTARASC